MQWSDEQVDDFYAVVGGRIKEVRTRSRLTQNELASRLGLTRSSVANIEAGRQRVQLHWLAQIAVMLDVGMNDLVELPERGRENLGVPDTGGLPDSTAEFLAIAMRRAGGG
jgi:transcriptional regulator with XRE-family HTH domain